MNIKNDDGKTVLFWQPGGFGDIFFLQKAAKYFIERGYKVIWPITSPFICLRDYIKDIEFPLEEEDFIGKEIFGNDKPHIHNNGNFLYFPIEKSYLYSNLSWMKTKYLIFPYCGYEIDDSNWVEYFKFERNYEREDRCRQILNVEAGEDYIFVNDTFASPPTTITREMTINSSMKIVRHTLEHLTMFNVFDLCWILENAKEIHTVETSLCYFIEKLNTTDNITMYSRKIKEKINQPDFSYVDHIYKKKWNFVL